MSDRAENSESCDAELIRMMRRGDRDAFAIIVERWQESLFRIAYRIVGTVADAVDVRQTVLLKVLESPDRLPEPESFPAWIRRCVINESLRLLRQSGMNQRAREHLLVCHATANALDTQDPKAEAIRSEEDKLLKAALERLNPEQRVQLALRFDEGLTFEQMAQLLNLPASTVKSQCERTIKQLRKLLTITVQGE